jgi:SAM-dependent methyltransferase
MEIVTTETNVGNLRRIYCEGLLELQPSSILDVGCGNGHLLRYFAQRAISVAGLESHESAPLQEALDDLNWVAGDAEVLPFADGAFDWVSMRHVPHHLLNPGRAFAEALRVCQRGIYVAEPYFDLSISSQANAQELDLWLKRQHRKSGMEHHPNIDFEGLLDLLPSDQVASTAQVTIPALGCRNIAAYFDGCLRWLNGLAGDHPEHLEFQSIFKKCQATGLGWNGSIVLTVNKKSTH